MHPVLKRIARNGSLTAVILGVMGYGYAELAGIWLAGQPTPRAAANAPPVQPAVDATFLRYRVPLAMAAWGFGFIVVAELVLYAIRGNPAATAKKPSEPPAPDPAEQLLEQLLAEADAAQAARAAEQGPGVKGQESGNPTPAVPPENPKPTPANPASVGILTPDS